MASGRRLAAISLFSGAGGFDLGLEAAGFESRFCTDIDYHSCKTLRMNRREGKARGTHQFLRSAVVLQRDVRTLSADTVLRAARLRPGEVALLTGGPPCQSFSVFGQRKGMEDPRGTLLWEFVRLVREIKPEAFIFENVYGLLSIDDGKTFTAFLEALSHDASGRQLYTVTRYLLDVSYYGVPQYRSRLIVFGTLNGVRVSKPPFTHWPGTGGNGSLPRAMPGMPVEQVALDFPEDHNLPPTPTVARALKGLPLDPDPAIPNHVGRHHSDRIIERYGRMKHGERDSVTRINKLNPDRPSFTIIVGSDKGGGKGHVHPYRPREVTPRESARMQTFPDHWAFSGTSKHPIRQIGNAVPPVFGAALAAHVMREVFGGDAPGYDEIVRRLGLTYLMAERPATARLVTPPSLPAAGPAFPYSEDPCVASFLHQTT